MRQTRSLTLVVALAIALSAVALIVAASASLRWRYAHDSPLMIYAGFLVAGGSVPYRDFFDVNMPGTYFVMAAVGRVLGWDDFGFRAFDVFCLMSISVSTFLWMRRFGNLSALAGSVAFPLWYLNGGPSMSLQREYIALVPFAGMLAVTTADTGLTPRVRTIVAGVLAGMSAAIKPQFLLLSLPLLPLLIQPGDSSAGWRRRTAGFLGGLLIPLGAMSVYLLFTGSLEPLVDMAVNYWPLYAGMTGGHTPIVGLPRLLYVVKSTGIGLATPYAPMAVVGLIAMGQDQTHSRYAWVLFGLLLATALYPAMSGQFWLYHWLPFYYVALCAASLSARVVEIREWSAGVIAPALALIVLLLVLSATSVSHLRHGRDIQPPKGGVPDEISGFLRSHMNSGDAVQPLDWTGGAVHGMLMARAPLATRFMYDYHFYHHVSHPYIGKLRRDFIDELSVKRPRFIIEILQDKGWPTGPDTTRQFPELQAFLEQHYAPAQQDTRYRILQRIDGAP